MCSRSRCSKCHKVSYNGGDRYLRGGVCSVQQM